MSILHKAQTKRLILDTAAQLRSKKFERVSDEWFDYLDGKLQELIASGIRSHPSVGITLYPPIRRGKEQE